MRLSLHQLREVATAAGVTSKPVASLYAATMMVESKGDPSIPAGDGGTSFGILQVHEPDWPAIAASTRAVMAAPFVSSYGRAVAEARLALPILRDATRQAAEAGEILQKRGFRVELADVLVITDAAWNGPGVKAWAESTGTGNPDEIRPGRGAEVRRLLAELGIGEMPHHAGAWVVPVAVAAGVGLAVWLALEAWE